MSAENVCSLFDWLANAPLPLPLPIALLTCGNPAASSTNLTSENGMAFDAQAGAHKLQCMECMA